MAGPGKPHLRKNVSEIAESFFKHVGSAPKPRARALDDGAVAIAAITSCTNTANPDGMIRAGLLARAAAARGLRPPSWVKTTFAPGSHATTRYLAEAGLMDSLEALGFHVIGYGCTTCGGKSGTLPDETAQVISERDVKVAAVLSGNRNFDGRIHRLVPAKNLCSPALVIAYALAGSVLIDFDCDPIAQDADGRDVFLADIWPGDQQVAEMVQRHVTTAAFTDGISAQTSNLDDWSAVEAQSGPLFTWDPGSLYIIRPPFFEAETNAAIRPGYLKNARVLGLFGDGLTTDHMSPSGEIPKDSPAGEYLLSHGVDQKDFNTYVGRRGNHHVMTRGTFANLRIQNLLTPEKQGWWTKGFPAGRLTDFYQASETYRRRGTPIIVLAGRDYGQGSSRDWAAKGQALLGVKAVIAGSFERIHRANLIGMGIVPLVFDDGQTWESLRLQGDEAYDLEPLDADFASSRQVAVTARHPDRMDLSFTATADLRTPTECQLILGGGIYAIASRF